MAYKFQVHDDGYRIQDALFDRFCDAFDYAQGGLITFILAIPENSEDDEEDEIA